MKKISLEELKQIQLEILIKVHKFCMCKGIDYTLGYGTLIGAIRHKGYIPWDDDIDIQMTRPNYDKFLATFNGYYPELQVFAPELDWDYYAPYANVCDKRTILYEGSIGHNGQTIGVKIDIFPVEGCPTDHSIYQKISKESTVYNALMSYKRRTLSDCLEGSIFKKCAKICLWLGLHIIPYSYLQKRVYKLSTRYLYDEMDMVAELSFVPFKSALHKEVFNEYIDGEFEGHTLKIVKHYDVLLRHIYGNYMQLPPEEQRVPHHSFEAYWL